RTRLLRVVHRRDPDVEGAVHGRDPAQRPAVGAQLYVRALWIAEQRVARDQRHFVDGGGRGGVARGGGGVFRRRRAGGQREADGGREQDAVHVWLSPWIEWRSIRREGMARAGRGQARGGARGGVACC